MIQQVVQNVLDKKNWSSVKFCTATSSRILMDIDDYEIDSFAVYIKHKDFNSVEVIDLQKIDILEVKTKKANGATDDIPFYNGVEG